MKTIINPTGKEIRHDSAGSGFFGASRGNRMHKGIDLVCVPGQPVVSPISGIFVRRSYPYADDLKYTGVLLKNDWIWIKMWYFWPDRNFSAGSPVVAGQAIGVAQNIAEKYKGSMIPHIHLQIDMVDPLVILEEGLP